ncbi:response regulator [Belnapia sp. T6]|uniref:Response regulator n=1 Tax=Belnapia mucosa TaxID=2804532 RepID=A0ABS1VCP0_9PROT|nr:response regulator [Belnapia mucosa]MBL6459452.1 response regulator [Belnapia mucosa]
MTVLLVEDDLIVRLTLADFFEEAGLDFLEAGNAEDALAIIKNPSHSIDVLVTDLDLGAGDNGLILAGKARQVRSGLPVIYQTGSPEMFAGHSFLPGEMVYYKPFDPRALAATVSSLGGKRPTTRRRQRPSARKTVASSL